MTLSTQCTTYLEDMSTHPGESKDPPKSQRSWGKSRDVQQRCPACPRGCQPHMAHTLQGPTSMDLEKSAPRHCTHAPLPMLFRFRARLSRSEAHLES